MKVGLNGLCCLAFPALFATPAFATFLPPNKLHLEDNINKQANMTRAEFDAIIDKAFNAYKDIVSAQGGKLQITHLWDDPTVNANASQSGSTWNVNMYGGLARRDEVTPDGFQAVVCHELGHHLGGFAFYGDTDWAANEGQSDYFTTHACLPKLWKNETEVNATFRANVNPTVKRMCDGIWHSEAEQNLCYRSADASRSLAALLAALNNLPAPSFDTPDLSEVTSTASAHPKAQCRLDTYFAGSLCPRPFNDNVIPAKNHPNGQTSVQAEEVSTSTSCHAASGFAVGVRPRCWYKPNLQFLALRIGESAMAEVGNGNGTYEPGEKVAFTFPLRNDTTDKIPTGVKGQIWTTTQGVTVTNATQEYPDLQPGQTVTHAEPYVLALDASMKCGAKVEMNFRATSDLGSVEQKKEFLLGKPVTDVFGRVAANLPIPDNKPSGIESTMEVTSDATISSVSVDLDITHTYVGDLKITLVAPNGKSVVVWNREGGSNDDIKQTVTKDFSVPNAQGTWKLQVSDNANSDQGTLNRWGLKVTRHVCQ